MSDKPEKDWFEVFTVVTEGTEEFWVKIGRMFPHKNGDGGFNIILNALPLDNKLVVKPRRKKDDLPRPVPTGIPPGPDNT